MQTARDIAGYPSTGPSASAPRPFLPMSRAEMDILGWTAAM